ncbi:MAG: hypothetical protein LBG97_04930 [Coriobacteriales bacterium]|jgi:hypothetical protein|nr:hypothetical protein [Coriobacteriales bacterium]
MDRETFGKLQMTERIAYINEKLAAGEDYEKILAGVGLTLREAGVAGFIKVGKEVREKPGKGDNGFAW